MNFQSELCDHHILPFLQVSCVRLEVKTTKVLNAPHLLSNKFLSHIVFNLIIQYIPWHVTNKTNYILIFRSV